MDDDPRRNLTERTGRHHCIRCLADTPADAYERNDHLCDACAADGDYPPPPGPPPTPKKRGK
jgi:hypothetical protein